MNIRSFAAALLLMLLLVAQFDAFSTPSTTVSGSAVAEATAYNSQRKVVRDSRGSIYVLYVRDAGGTPSAHLVKSTDSGFSWSDVGAVSEEGPSWRAAITIDSKDNLHVVWTHGTGDGSEIRYGRFGSRGWSPIVTLSQGGGYSGFPSIAVDSKDNLHVVWYGFDGEFYQIFYSSWNGATWSRPLQISTGTPDSVNPSIAVDSSDDLHAVWYKRVAANYQIWYRRFAGTWENPATISFGDSDSFNPSVAIDSKSTVHVVWDKLVEEETQIFYSRYDGKGWSKQLQISFGSTSSENPTITLDHKDNVYVFWDSSDGTIYLRKYEMEWKRLESFALGARNSFPSARWSFFNDRARSLIDLVWTAKTEQGFLVMYDQIQLDGETAQLLDPVVGVSLALVFSAMVALAYLRKRTKASKLTSTRE